MQRNLQHFIAERADRLAIVYLTRSKDISVERMKADSGLDLLVTILREQLPTGRIFGVQAKGQDKAFKSIQEIRFSERYDLQDAPFPICLMLFTMDDDKGYYKWIKHPVEANNQWRFLDEYPIEQMIADVNAWYDEKSHSAA